MTTLENLYNGNINPCELERLSERKDYKTATTRVSEAQKELEEILTETQQLLFDKYTKEWDMMSLIVEEEIFKEGFAIATIIREEVTDIKEATMWKRFEDMPPMLTVPETAEILRISQNHLYYLLKKDKTFPVLQIGRRCLIPKDELKKWVNRCATGEMEKCRK
ncbi:MAG: helix-turn-helix domain-containing protein [Eubacterium sp.]|nr:helix-turn-helix domain-containing protein [Eubacterium sp.]